MKKGGLGKGLDALFAENTPDEQGKTISLRISDINPNRGQPRKSFDQEALADLAESIAQHGVLQPLLVRPLSDGSYQLVAGERRWRASRMAGLTEVPVVVRNMTDQQAAEMALIENLQREDLNPIEEALGFRTLMDTYGLTQEEVAKSVNKSRPAVANALRLLHLPEPVLAAVTDGRLSPGHARSLLPLSSAEQQQQMAQQVVEQGLSVRQVEQMVKTAQSKKGDGVPSSTKPLPRESFYREVELSLSEYLGRRIKVSEGKKGGFLQIEFYDKEDLTSLANGLSQDK